MWGAWATERIVVSLPEMGRLGENQVWVKNLWFVNQGFPGAPLVQG